MENCNCNPKTYNIGMGCCRPVLAPIENYYTKYQIDEMFEEIESGITSGCCITPEEVDDKITSAKTDIESEIPSLDGYATEEWVEDKHYITGVDLSDYATTAYVNTQISSQTGDFVTGEQLSSYTYDKSTIDLKIASGGSFDPTQYYNKTETDNLLDDKLDVSAYTPTDLSNYYNKTEVDDKISSAKTEIEGEIPTVPTDVSAFNNDAGYLTEHQSLSAYSTTSEVNNLINQATSGFQDTLSAGTNVQINNNVISATDTKYTAGDGISISNNNIISTTTKFLCLTEAQWASVSGNPDTNTVYLIH